MIDNSSRRKLQNSELDDNVSGGLRQSQHSSAQKSGNSKIVHEPEEGEETFEGK